LRVRLFLHTTLRVRGKPLYVAVVELARQEGMAGATVFHGIEGYGIHHHVHLARLADVGEDLPVIVEIIDTPDAIERFLVRIEGLIPHGLATLSPVQVLKYAPGPKP
jgi:PII-like signaling protein